ncbi:MAG: hypothetical protein M0Z51_16885 [Propionibacterium sp.]|nr:hypothetical protein [Propionibacterium sp.]
MTTVKAFKGFDADLKCRGFQYAEGASFTHDGPVSICNSGFHAVTLPLDVLSYYPAPKSIYREVELEGVTAKTGGDSKVAGRKITVGASVNLAGIVKAHVEAIWTQVKKPSEKTEATTGDSAHAATTGDYAHAATTGYSAHAATTGDYANAATTGRYANASTTGYSDDVRASVADEGAIAAVLGRGAARGAIGCWLVLTERDDGWNILGVKAVPVDGKKVKADTFYTLRGGKVVAA